jgi:hypothetical protein
MGHTLYKMLNACNISLFWMEEFLSILRTENFCIVIYVDEKTLSGDRKDRTEKEESVKHN